MGVFSRGDSPDVIDYTMLQKRGLLKVPAIVPHKGKILPDGTLDLTGTEETTVPTSTMETNQQANPFAFLDAPASTPSTSFFDTPTSPSSTSSFPLTSSDLSAEVSSLRIKLEDLEYKLARAIEKIDALGK